MMGRMDDEREEPEPITRAQRVVALLEDNIYEELCNVLREEQLPDEVLRNAAWAVATEALYAFDVDWNPDWVKPGRLHSWRDGGRFFARCPVCLLDSPASKTRAEAYRWVRAHERDHDDASV